MFKSDSMSTLFAIHSVAQLVEHWSGNASWNLGEINLRFSSLQFLVHVNSES